MKWRGLWNEHKIKWYTIEVADHCPYAVDGFKLNITESSTKYFHIPKIQLFRRAGNHFQINVDFFNMPEKCIKIILAEIFQFENCDGSRESGTIFT